MNALPRLVTLAPLAAAPAIALAAAAADADYAVAVSGKTYADPGWRKVADALAQKHKGRVVIFPGDSPSSARTALSSLSPRFIAFLATPAECGRAYVADAARTARSLDADPYDDAVWSVFTAIDAASALRQANERRSVVVRSALGTTGLTEDRFDRLLVFSDAGEGARISKVPGAPAKTTKEHKNPDAPDWADWFSKNKPELIVTSSHGFENGVEMPYGRGMILSRGDSLQVVTDLASLKRDYAGRAGAKGAPSFPAIPPDSTPRAWLAAGNCLVAHCTAPDALAPVAMSRYGVSQFAGYTVASWHGAAGWGSLGLFLDGRYAYSMADAVWFNRQKLVGEVAGISPAALDFAPAYDETRESGSDIRGFFNKVAAAGLLSKNIPRDDGRRLVGHLWDRDTFVMFGDPAESVTFPAAAKPGAPSITWEKVSDASWRFSCTWPAGAKLDGLPSLGFRFPAKFAAAPSAKDAPTGMLLADDFLLIPAPRPDSQGRITFIIDATAPRS